MPTAPKFGAVIATTGRRCSEKNSCRSMGRFALVQRPDGLIGGQYCDKASGETITGPHLVKGAACWRQKRPVKKMRERYPEVEVTFFLDQGVGVVRQLNE